MTSPHFRSDHGLLLILALAAACSAEPDRHGRLTPDRATPVDPADGSKERRAPGQGPAYFVSIDGLQPDLLTILADAGRLDSSQGLGWLLRDSLVSLEAQPVVTALTAPSHTSTITCTPPSRHGVYANGYLAGGRQVSGFEAEPRTEPLWRAAMGQGQTVLSLGYVGTDGTSPTRRASFGLAYPREELMGTAQSLQWTLNELPRADGWSLPEELREQAGLKETRVTIVLNPQTAERQIVEVLVVPAATGGATLHFSRSKDLVTDRLGVLAPHGPQSRSADLFFHEKEASSPQRGIKRRVLAHALPAPSGRIQLYLSRASYNQAYPDSFRRLLDDRGLVWPDYGIREQGLGLDQWLEAQALIDRFLAEVARAVVPELAVDIVLFYQPLIDAVAHRLQSKLPRPFDPRQEDEVTRAFVRAYETIDRNLSDLLSETASRAPVFVMGDHGMDGIEKAVNLATLLPLDLAARAELFTSGDLILLYPRPAAGDQASASEEALALGDELKAKLTSLTYRGRSVLGKAVRRTDFETGRSSDYRREWPYGEAVWAFAAAPGLWFQYQPLVSETFVEPEGYGMHGKGQPDTDLKTAFMAKGPRVPSRKLGPISLLDVVPTFSKVLGIRPPRDCMGSALF